MKIKIPSHFLPILFFLFSTPIFLFACAPPENQTQVLETPSSLPSVESLTYTPTISATPSATFTEQINLPILNNDHTPTPTPLPPTFTPTPTPFVFAVIGDFGEAGPDEAAVAALVQSWNPEIIITLGDNNYPNGSESKIDENVGQYYHNYLAPYIGSYGPGGEINRFFPVPGNHDWDSPNLEPYLNYFTLPGNERYYEFTWGPVHFFAINSDSREPHGVNQSSIQANWFEFFISNSTAPWQIAYMHHAPYSSGSHGSTTWMQWPFKDWGIDAVLAAHDHVYERLEADNIPYFTNGLGGNPYRYLFTNVLPESEVRYRAEHGAMRVTATDITITFEFINIHGELIDSLTLTNPSMADNPSTDPLPTDDPITDVVTFPDPAAFNWQPVGTGYNSPVFVTHAGDGSNRLFIVEQAGVIQILGENTPFLDIRDRVGDEGNEQGLLGLAFHPDYEKNGSFYVNYTDQNGDTVIARFQVSENQPNQADPDSETILLNIHQPYQNHNGGHMAFGPKGYLYIATGDGGSAGDPERNAQNTFTLLGKILRIDVNAEPYNIPPDNPFLNGDGLPEIWGYGLRNPWRFTFDRQTGDLYIGDVGQNAWEEIDFMPVTSHGGENFGWDYLEGTHVYEGNVPSGLALTAPIWEYSHAGNICSVTGGVVYRGTTLPKWSGVYLYGDYCSGQVWGLLRNTNGDWENTLLFETDFSITSFGEDEAGEVYLVARQGEIYRLVSP